MYKDGCLFFYFKGGIDIFLSLLGVTIGAGLVDSLNPIAIAQQFVLQSSAKNKHSILAYIFGIGLTNFIFGLLFYFGLAQIIRSAYESIQTTYPRLIPTVLIILGIALIVFCIYHYFSSRCKQEVIKEEELEPVRKNLSAVQLFGIGVASCLAELSSALPYIGYLTFLVSANIHWVMALFLLVFYNLFVFNWPLYVLYAVSVYYDAYLVKIYTRFYRIMSYVIEYGLPILGVLLGCFFIYYGIQNV